MKFIFKLLALFFIVLSAVNNLSAQEEDWGTWIDVAANKKFKSATFSLDGEFYTQKDNRKIERTSIGLDGKFPVNSFMTLDAGYLLMNYNMTGYQEIRNRFFSTVSVKWRLSDFVFSHRERIQLTRKPDPEINVKNDLYWRNRFRMEYKKEGWKVIPSVTIESFYSFGKQGTKSFDEFRYSLACGYGLTTNQHIKLYGLWSDTVHKNFYVVGLEYEISI